MFDDLEQKKNKHHSYQTDSKEDGGGFDDIDFISKRSAKKKKKSKLFGSFKDESNWEMHQPQEKKSASWLDKIIAWFSAKKKHSTAASLTQDKDNQTSQDVPRKKNKSEKQNQSSNQNKGTLKVSPTEDKQDQLSQFQHHSQLTKIKPNKNQHSTSANQTTSKPTPHSKDSSVEDGVKHQSQADNLDQANGPAKDPQPKAKSDKEPQLYHMLNDADKQHKDDQEMDVNLLPTKRRLLNDTQMMLSYIMIIVIGILAVGIPYIYYQGLSKGYQNNKEKIIAQTKGLEQKNEELIKQIREWGTLSEKIDELEPLLDAHIYWSRFMPVLEKNTLRNVYFRQFQANSENYQVSLDGMAYGLRDAAEQVVAFEQNTQLQNIYLNSLNFIEPAEEGGATIDFGLTFNIDPMIVNLSPGTAQAE